MSCSSDIDSSDIDSSDNINSPDTYEPVALAKEKAADLGVLPAAGSSMDKSSLNQKEKKPHHVKDQSIGTSKKFYLLGAGVVALIACFLYLLYSAFAHNQFGWMIVLVLLGFGATLGFILVIICYYLAGVAMSPPWYVYSGDPVIGLTQQHIPEYWQGVCHDPKTDLGLDYEDIEFETKLGGKTFDQHLTLRGWFIPVSKKCKYRRKVVIVAVHGGGRDRRAFLRHSAFFHAKGYPILLFDFREHGTSDGLGNGFTYGVKEHLDVEAAVAFAKEKTRCRACCVLATSVGATATIIAASHDRNIDAVIAENPLTRPEELISFIYWMGIDYAMPSRFSRSFVFRWFGRMVVAIFLWRIGALREDSLWPNHRGAVDLVHRISPRPILIMHGDEDKIIPVDHSTRIYAAALEPKFIWIAKGAVHCALYDRRPSEYKQKVLGFLETLEDSLFKASGKRSRSMESLSNSFFNG